MTKKPSGLGKRQRAVTDALDATTESGACAETGAEVYFPVEDDKNEVQHILAMGEYAEAVLGEPEKCTSLLRAVVHECDRLGRLKERLDAEEAVEGLDAEQAASLNKLVLDDQFYCAFGDALYQLAFLDVDPTEEEISGELLEAALERYQCGLEEFRESHSLLVRSERALLVLSLTGKGPSPKPLFVRQLISASNDPAETLFLFIGAFERASSFLNEAGKDIISLLNVLAEECSTLAASEKDQAQSLALAHLSVLLMLVDISFEREQYDLTSKYLSLASSILDGDTDTDSVDGDLAEPGRRQHCLQLRAQYYIWKGCMEEVREDSDDPLEHASMASSADHFYRLAVETWQEISNCFGVAVPDHVLKLTAPQN